jgi:hypothetical protein
MAALIELIRYFAELSSTAKLVFFSLWLCGLFVWFWALYQLHKSKKEHFRDAIKTIGETQEEFLHDKSKIE